MFDSSWFGVKGMESGFHIFEDVGVGMVAPKWAKATEDICACH